METMTITAGCRIWISIEDSLAMDALRITIIRMAGGAFLNHPRLVPFPGGHVVNIFVAVFTLNFIDKMGTGIMLSPFFFVATVAGDGLGMDSCSFGLDMVFDVRNIPVTAITGICSVNRLGKLPLIDFVSMATQAFRVINALVAIFTAFDDKLLSLLRRIRRFCTFSRLWTLFHGSRVGCPKESAIQKEEERKGDESGK